MSEARFSIEEFNKILGGTLWSKQDEIFSAVAENERVSVRSCFGSGKTYLAGRITLWFLYSFPPPTKVITTAPTNMQVEMQLWKEIRKQQKEAKGLKFKNQYFKLDGRLLRTSLELDEDWFALGFRPRETEPERFQGWHARNILVIFDEAVGIPKKFWEAKEGLMSSENSKFLSIGNPSSPMGDFYDSFKEQNTVKIHIDAFETPNLEGISEEDLRGMTIEEVKGIPLRNPSLVTPLWVWDKITRWGIGTPLYQSKVRGNFSDEGVNTIIPLLWIEEAENRWV